MIGDAAPAPRARPGLPAARRPPDPPAADGLADTGQVGADILELIGQGRTLAQVARALAVPESTVRRHINLAMAEAGLLQWPVRMSVLLRTCEGQAAPPLSPRERQVADLIRAGHGLPEIARVLHIATGTVRAHLHRALAKCGVGHTPSGMRAHLCRYLAAARTQAAADPGGAGAGGT